MFPVGVSLSEAPLEAKVRAVSRVLAAQANLDERVRQFRESVLSGSLLAPDAIAEWIHQRAQEEGEPSYWLSSIPVERAEIRGTFGSSPVEVGPFQLADYETRGYDYERPSFERRMLSYVTPEFEETTVPVRAGGILDALRKLSHGLAYEDYPWQERQASAFVLTGLIPNAQAFVDAQPRRKGQRDLTLRTLELAVFQAEHEGEPLAERWAKWNGAHPDYTYNHATTFGWDSRRAYRRILGMPEPSKERQESAAASLALSEQVEKERQPATQLKKYERHIKRWRALPEVEDNPVTLFLIDDTLRKIAEAMNLDEDEQGKTLAEVQRAFAVVSEQLRTKGESPV
jgi:hypothetical protein